MSSVKGAMRLVEEKYAMNEIDIIIWSNKIDLLALSNIKGEVTLHRLDWQRVWSLPPPVEELRVTALSWRPDGRVLVIAYNNREVLVVDIEKKVVVHTINAPHDVCFVHWTQESTDNYNRYDEYLRMMCDAESGCLLDTAAPAKDSNDIPIENFRNIKIYSHLNFLLIGVSTGEIHVYVFGLFCCGIIDIKQHLPPNSECTVLSADITQNLKSFVAVLNVKYNNIQTSTCIVLDTSELFDRSQDLYTISSKRGSILNTVSNINRSMVNIIEAHEHIVLQEMQMQIFEYSKNKEEGTLSAEFMELLLFGFYSAELATFLLNELSDKKLKKISSSIEVSHSNIQKQIVQQLRPNLEKLLFELSIMLGLSRLSRIFPESRIIMDEDLIYKSIVTAGAFYIKANKVLQILENSSIKYKTFFGWLGSVASIISNDRSGNSPFEVNQREMNFISNYLCEIDSSTPIFEKDELGQYLVDKEITFKNATNSQNLWRKFLSENPCLQDYEMIIPRTFDNKSLVQTHKYLTDSVDIIFNNFSEYIRKDFPVSYQSDLFSSENSIVRKISCIEAPKQDKIFIGFMKPTNNDGLLQISEISKKPDGQYTTRNATVYFEETEYGTFDLIDLQFYTHEIISVLLEKKDCLHSFCIQLPIENIQTFYNLNEPQNVFSIIEKDCLKIIENMKSLKFAVSGPRQVSVIVAEDGHRVRIFEMEANDEEENANNTTNMSGDEPNVSSKLTNTDVSMSDDDFVSNPNFEAEPKADTSTGTANTADESDDRIHIENSVIDFGEIDVNNLSLMSDFTNIENLLLANHGSSLDTDLERDIASLNITSQSSKQNSVNVPNVGSGDCTSVDCSMSIDNN
ncbi:anaphase-promoting complex subunit 4-like [Planococcus citri]|uniref:anaphase-promoting complex subunit 4-like n=1 Tax=Planococcus citri TaxID=170843 RepID=UPI0031F7810C